MSRPIIAIDLGLDGALVRLRLGHPPEIEDMPTVTKKSGKRKRRDVDIARLVVVLQHWARASGAYPLAVVERATPRPPGKKGIMGGGNKQGHGVIAAFKLGIGLGASLAALESVGVPYRIVMPAQWKPSMVGVGADKETSRLKAIECFPESVDMLKRKKDHNRAEALLLARWLQLELENQPCRPRPVV